MDYDIVRAGGPAPGVECIAGGFDLDTGSIRGLRGRRPGHADDSGYDMRRRFGRDSIPRAEARPGNIPDGQAQR